MGLSFPDLWPALTENKGGGRAPFFHAVPQDRTEQFKDDLLGSQFGKPCWQQLSTLDSQSEDREKLFGWSASILLFIQFGPSAHGMLAPTSRMGLFSMVILV